VISNLKIDFLQSSSTSIHYLVGNNGAGKTHILEALYKGIHGEISSIHGSVEFDLVVNDQVASKDCSLQCKWNQGSYNPGTIVGLDASKEDAERNRKAVLSGVEINFQPSDIKSTTADTADEETPREKSINLQQQIPQLLINLRQQDANLRSDWMAQNSGSETSIPQYVPGEKLHRFIKAYDTIFDGQKKFKEIREVSGKYNIIFQDAHGAEIELGSLSSGEKQVIYRIGFILKNLETLNEGLVFIDEPELSLHPQWQLNFKKLLLQIFDESSVQIFIATHSPYIFGELDSSKEECIKIDRTANSAKRIEFPVGIPSMNMVNFLAFGIPSKELHVELYSVTQEISAEDNIALHDIWLEQKGLAKENRSKAGTENFSGTSRSALETKPTWIRNKTSHADNLDRKDFSETDLDSSLKEMIMLL